MIKIRTWSRSAVLTASCIGLISAAPPNEVPGKGVLCLGTFIYFVEKTGSECRVGQDAEFQARIATFSKRFDDYIIRNTGGDPAVLERFKEGQNLNSEDHRYICEGDAAESYDVFKSADAGELTRAVDELLADDGPPSFGDCV